MENYFDYMNGIKRTIMAEVENQDALQHAVFGFLAHGVNAGRWRLPKARR
jgi:hypothetical protein